MFKMDQERDELSVDSDAETNASPVKKKQKKGWATAQENAVNKAQVEEPQHDVQTRILQQLQKVNERLDVMEGKVEEVAQIKGKYKTKLSKNVSNKKVFI